MKNRAREKFLHRRRRRRRVPVENENIIGTSYSKLYWRCEWIYARQKTFSISFAGILNRIVVFVVVVERRWCCCCVHTPWNVDISWSYWHSKQPLTHNLVQWTQRNQHTYSYLYVKFTFELKIVYFVTSSMRSYNLVSIKFTDEFRTHKWCAHNMSLLSLFSSFIIISCLLSLCALAFHLPSFDILAGKF